MIKSLDLSLLNPVEVAAGLNRQKVGYFYSTGLLKWLKEGCKKWE